MAASHKTKELDISDELSDSKCIQNLHSSIQKKEDFHSILRFDFRWWAFGAFLILLSMMILSLAFDGSLAWHIGSFLFFSLVLGFLYWRISQSFDTLFSEQEKQVVALSSLCQELKDAENAQDDLSQLLSLSKVELSQSHAELRRSSVQRSEFLSNMNHELRTPMNPILGMSELLKEGIYGELNPAQFRAVSIIETSAKHLNQLINDILSLSKIDAGSLELEVIPLSIKDLIYSCLMKLKERMSSESIHFSLDIDNFRGQIEGDARLLEQLFCNLLSNTIKFTPKDEKAGLKIISDEHKQMLQILVWDKGSGIAKEDLKRIFEPFMQLDQSLSRSSQGTGLGLALVARIAKIHGGSVGVKSAVGEGTTFTISLPWKSPYSLFSDELCSYHSLSPISGSFLPYGHVENSQDDRRERLSFDTPKQPKRTSHRKTILIVDDTNAVLKALRWYLQEMGHHVVEARNGEEALLCIEKENPSLLLIEMELPVVSGKEVVQTLREEEKDLSIVACSSLLLPDEQESCLALGCDAFLPKPIPFHLLDEMLASYL